MRVQDSDSDPKTRFPVGRKKSVSPRFSPLIGIPLPEHPAQPGLARDLTLVDAEHPEGLDPIEAIGMFMSREPKDERVG